MNNVLGAANGTLDWQTIASIVSAAAAIAALIVSIGLPALRTWWRRPRFSIQFRQTVPYCRKTEALAMQPPSGLFTIHALTPITKNTYWIRLEVKNYGRSVARKCLGKLVEITDENGKRYESFDPTQLQWSGASWVKAPLPTIDLNTDDYEYLNILFTQEEDNIIYIAGDQLRFVEGEKRGITDHLPKGKYVLRIILYGDNVKPETRFIGLVWDGNSIEDVKVNLYKRKDEAQSMLLSQQTSTNEHICSKGEATQNRDTVKFLINPLTLGIAYFGFSLLLLGLEHKTSISNALGWVTFGTSILLFIAVFEKHLAKLLNEKGRVALLASASVLGTAGIVISLLNFLSGKSGWIVTAFLLFLLLWLFAIAGAEAGVAKNKKLILIVPLGVGIMSVIKFVYSDYIQGAVLLAFGIFLFLAARGTIKMSEPPDS